MVMIPVISDFVIGGQYIPSKSQKAGKNRHGNQLFNYCAAD